MHVIAQTGTRSPKQANGPTSTSQLKAASDSGQNSGTSTRGRKRERIDRAAKRERPSRNDEGDSDKCRQESSLKNEIAQITEKGGLIDGKWVESLVQLMQHDRMEKKMDLVSRTMLVNVMASTDKDDCFNGFVQLRGLPILDEWLQDIHKGKIKGSDKSVEEFLLVLLRVLDKLPVNLQALRMCNIGRSVNHLRSHKNVEIHRKARTLVDTWKKSVEAEMRSMDSKAASLPSKSHLPVASQSDPKSSVTQNSISKSASLGSIKALSSPSSDKESHPKTSVGGNNTPQIQEDRSSTSNQSQNSDSVTVDKISSNLKFSCPPGISGTGSQKETESVPAHKSTALEKLSHSALPSERVVEGPTSDENSHKLILEIPNSVKSDEVSMDKIDTCPYNAASDMNMCQNNESKDVLTGSKGADEEQRMMTDDSKRTIEGFKSDQSKLGNLHSSFSPTNALIESCAKHSEATSSLSTEDDVRMNLLASVAAGEISKSNIVSPNSSERSIPVIETLCNDDQTKSKSSPKNGSTCDKHVVSDVCSFSNNGLHLSEDGEPDKEEIHDEKTTSCNVISDRIPNCRSVEFHVTESKDGGGIECKQKPSDTAIKSEFGERDDNEKLKQTQSGQKSISEANDAVKAEVETASIHQPGVEDNTPGGKLVFDLNEDYDADDVKCVESTKTSTTVHTNSTITSGHSAAVTVTAAAKGGFVPPEDLLRSNVELGWKGSAATSAFRPAESRKHDRISLDFDLNVADERVLEELPSRDCAALLNDDSVPAHDSGVLDFDLNRLDEPNEASVVHFKPNVQRDFDLNNGPVVDDDRHSIKQVSNVIMSQLPSAGIRMSSPGVGPGPGGFSSWFPPGTSYSTVTIPAILPNQTQQPFPVFPSNRIYSSAGIAPFNPDTFRGPVLSSSPAVPIPSTSFQFPVIPYATSYPLPSGTLPVGAASYSDGARLFPQYVGPVGSFSSQFQRPHMVSLPGISNNGGVDSYRNSSRQGLDLNAGPGATESEVRDEMARLSSGQYSVPGRSILKRKEPGGGRGNETFRNRQYWWQ